ncbi:hypothetical protein [Pectobacterium quasiaquaticum]|uniref:hypothetical protein n=1 Tax=Pectobacterium quasiaquaticum TaxID=2774015 RepID=UPI001CF7AE86|nr:hypothetical protein [Pectobacterium quasiaquaticum]
MTANLNANSVITNGMKDGLSLMQTAEPGPQPVKLGDTILLAEKFPDANSQYPVSLHFWCGFTGLHSCWRKKYHHRLIKRR